MVKRAREGKRKEGKKEEKMAHFWGRGEGIVVLDRVAGVVFTQNMKFK